MFQRKLVKYIQQTQIRHFQLYWSVFAGHSKWANIKHIKAEKDGQKSLLFTKLSRQIRLAVQEGGSANPDLNNHLKHVIEEAVKKNMPLTTIKNTIRKCDNATSSLKEYIIGIRFQKKVFAMCIVYTDNLAALKMELAPILRKMGGCYVEANHLFDDFGYIAAKLRNEKLHLSELIDKATNDAIECGIEDLEVEEDSNTTINFICNPKEINSIHRGLELRGYDVLSSGHVYNAKNPINLSSIEETEYTSFLKKLQSITGMENIFDNNPINLSSIEETEYTSFLKKLQSITGMENIFDNVNRN